MLKYRAESGLTGIHMSKGKKKRMLAVGDVTWYLPKKPRNAKVYPASHFFTLGGRNECEGNAYLKEYWKENKSFIVG